MARNRIAELRHEAEMSQKELGCKLGIVQTTISAWENGRNQPDFASMQKMAQLFNCSIDYLMDRSVKSRGLSKEQISAIMQAKREEKELSDITEDSANDWLAEAGLTEKEIAEIIETEEYKEWDKVKKDILLEGYKINKMLEDMSRTQRKMCVEIIEKIHDEIV